MPSFSTLLTGIGAILMAHAAYSTLHFRSILQDLGDVDEPIPPMDVYIEISISLFLVLVGQLMGAGTMQSVDVFAKNHRMLAAPAYKTRKFDIYTHRKKTKTTKPL